MAVLNYTSHTHLPQLVMSQVLAAINHRLSEEYSKIELSGQEAKDRYALSFFPRFHLGSKWCAY